MFAGFLPGFYFALQMGNVSYPISLSVATVNAATAASQSGIAIYPLSQKKPDEAKKPPNEVVFSIKLYWTFIGLVKLISYELKPP